MVQDLEGQVKKLFEHNDQSNACGNVDCASRIKQLHSEVVELNNIISDFGYIVREKENQLLIANESCANTEAILVRVAASLAASISLLERGGRAAKRNAPSDRMFDQMLIDYKRSLESARETLRLAKPDRSAPPSSCVECHYCRGRGRVNAITVAP